MGTVRLNEVVAEGCPGDAVGLFMMLVGATPEQVEGMHQHPLWPVWEAIGHTLAYDAAAMGADSSVPTARAARVRVPTLVMNGEASYPFMRTAAETLANVMPNARHRVLEGQTHEVSAEVLGPVLVDFFGHSTGR